MKLQLDYKVLKQPKVILITTILVVIIYNGLIYLHPANQSWFDNGEFSWGNLLRFLLIEQIFCELFTTTIISLAVYQYSLRLKLLEISLSIKEISKYYAKFIPVSLFLFFLFNPVTQSVRFLINEYPSWPQETYFYDYIFNWTLYPVYLIPTFLTGYGLLTYNLIRQYNNQLSDTKYGLEKLSQHPKYSAVIQAYDDWGEVPLDIEKVIFIEKEGRKYIIKTEKHKLRSRDTLSELEEKLDPTKFVRINRSVIVHVPFILNYSFWENDKYILRLNDASNTEFVMPRNRLKKFKAQLQLKS